MRQQAIDNDLSDPDFHRSEGRFRYFAMLRKEDPVHWCPEANGPGYWSVTRYQDVIDVLKDSSAFSSDIRNGGNRLWNAQDVNPNPRPHLLTMDPPEHTQLRRALAAVFAAPAIRRLETGIRNRVARAVDAIAPVGQADFVTSVSVPVTLGLLTDMLEVPEGESGKLLAWSLAMVGDDDPDYQLPAKDRLDAMRELDRYVATLSEDVANKGPDSIFSCLMNATIDGKKMDFETLTVNFAAFLIAANETTRHAISNSLHALTEYPEEKQKLIANPALIPAAAKELIRWATPLMHVRKTAMFDVQLGGKTIRKGDKVVVWYSAANRDEGVWPDADRLAIDRYTASTAAPHLAFGYGSHYCLGWRLAEIQLTTVLTEVLRRIPDIRVIDDPAVLRSNFIHGVKKLTVSFTPEQAG